MKPELNKKDRTKQNKLRKMLSQEQSLSHLVRGTKGKKGSGKGSEETPDFVLDGTPLPPLINGGLMPPEIHYTVRKGDTLESIAKGHRTTVDELIKLNEMSDEQAARLKVGQNIRIY